MATIGYDSTTDAFGFTSSPTDTQLIQLGTGQVYTAGANESITEVGFHSWEGSAGTIEIGVYRTDTLAKIGSTTVDGDGASAARYTTSVNWALTEGVEYAVAWRWVTAAKTYRTDQIHADAATTQGTLTSESALPATFEPVDTPPASQNYYTIFATVESSSGAYTLTAESGTYSTTGQDVTLTSTAPNAYTLTAEYGTYLIIGSPALADYVIRAESGTYSTSGKAASLNVGWTLSAESGTYSLTGQSADLSYSEEVSETTSGGLYGNITLKIRSVYAVSATGKVKWKDYIPVKQVTPGSGSLNTYNNDGAIGVDILASNTGLVEWVDYIPVVEVTDGDSGRWRTDSTGFIPIVQNS